MSKKMLDFGVVTFDSSYNPDKNRFHVRAEIELDITFTDEIDRSVSSKWVSRYGCYWSGPLSNRVAFVRRDCIIEISHRGKRIEYASDIYDSSELLITILDHSELGDNDDFQALYDFCYVPDENIQRLREIWDQL